jgi:hypothetical protein
MTGDPATSFFLIEEGILEVIIDGKVNFKIKIN